MIKPSTILIQFNSNTNSSSSIHSNTSMATNTHTPGTRKLAVDPTHLEA
jgi:hypothetical protein